MFSNLHLKLGYIPCQYDRLCLGSYKIATGITGAARLLLAACAFGWEVHPVKVRTLNERNNHRVKRYRSGITYRWCESIEAPSFEKGSNHMRYSAFQAE